MKFNVYSVKDELIGKFLQPIFLPTDKEALRMFKYMVNNDAIWRSNPSQFSLYSIGEFDEESGISWTENKMIQGGTSVVERTENV